MFYFYCKKTRSRNIPKVIEDVRLRQASEALNIDGLYNLG